MPARPAAASLPPGDAGESVVTLERGDAVVLVRLDLRRAADDRALGPARGLGGRDGSAARRARDARRRQHRHDPGAGQRPARSTPAGWLGRPGLLGHRAGQGLERRLRPRDPLASHHRHPGCRERLRAPDLGGRATSPADSSWAPRSSCSTPACCACGRTVRNTGPSPFEVTHLEPALPVPPRPSSCSTSPAATPTSDTRSAARSTSVPGCASPGVAGPATTRRPCCVPARRPSATGGARCGGPTCACGGNQVRVRRAVGHRLAPAARG